MTREQKDLLFALCFGDGCAREKTAGKGSKTLYGEFVVTHSDKQLAYLEWKQNLIHSILGGKKQKIWKYHRRVKGSMYFNGYIATKDNHEVGFRKGHPYFKVIRRMMYKNGVKTFSRAVLNRLSLLGLLIWYLDDGTLSLGIRGGRLRSYHVKIQICKPLHELQVIVDYFTEVWGLTPKINRSGNGKYPYCLRFGKRNGGEKLLKLFQPLVKEHIPSMLYKVDLSQNARAQSVLQPKTKI